MNPATQSILLAEDDENDVFLLQHAFKEAGLDHPLTVVTDGQSAIDFFSEVQEKPSRRLPALVLLDLKMPRRTGLQVLQWIRAMPIIRTIPVMILSSSDNRIDVEYAYEAGATAYLIKPPSLAERNNQAKFIGKWLRMVHPPIAVAESLGAAQSQRRIL